MGAVQGWQRDEVENTKVNVVENDEIEDQNKSLRTYIQAVQDQLRKFELLIMTGLAQPKRAMRSMIRPSGSI